MAVFNYLNNCIGQVFDVLEDHSRIPFATFTMNESSKTDQGMDGEEKVFMKQYKSTVDEQVYKYIYDPDLSFDDRFHQRIASIKYTDRNQPWVTIMFNSGTVRGLTEVVSTNQYRVVKNSAGEAFNIKAKRVRVPINMVLVSNDISTLYSVTERLALFFDRIVNIDYCEFVEFPSGVTDEYENTCQCMDITEVDLTKLDISSRGSLVTSAYTFGLVYWVTEYPKEVKLLERITIEVAMKGVGTLTKLVVQ